MKQKGRSMRYVLNERFALRGWDRLPWAVVRRPDNAVQFVDKSTFRVLSLCDGTIDLALPLFDERIRTIARELERQGIVRALAEGERAGLTDDQRYVCHPNRCIRTAHWSITGRCNYRCKHCYMDAPDALLGELDHDTVMDIARQIVDAGILRVNLTGGEPLVRRDFLDIVDFLVDHHVIIHQIYSNGRLVTHNPECAACAYRYACGGGCRGSALATTPDDVMAPDRALCLLYRGGYLDRVRAAAQGGAKVASAGATA